MVFDGKNDVVASANFPEDATNVKVQVKNAEGVVVRSVTIDKADAGRLQLPWDGTTDTQALNEDGTPKVDKDGNPVMEIAPKGVYTISVEGSIAGKNEAIVDVCLRPCDQYYVRQWHHSGPVIECVWPRPEKTI